MKNILRRLQTGYHTYKFYKNLFIFKRILPEWLRLICGGVTSFPLTINLWLSNKCNFTCDMCAWHPVRVDAAVIEQEELDIETLKVFFASVREYKPVIHLGGGEPFLYKNVIAAVEAVKNNELPCIIHTNGYLLDVNKIEALMQARVDTIVFSLYGTEGVHDSIVQVNGAYAKLISNLRDCVRLRSPQTRIIASTIPRPENIHDLDTLIDHMKDIGVDAVKVEHLNYVTKEERQKGSSDQTERDMHGATFMLGKKFDRAFVDILWEKYKEITRRYPGFVFFKPLLSKQECEQWYLHEGRQVFDCHFVQHSVFIDHCGNVIPCQYLYRCVLGNIVGQSLVSIWRSRKYQQIRQLVCRTPLSICKRCCKQ